MNHQLFVYIAPEKSFDWIAFLSMVSTIATAFFAAWALFSWRSQKLYDLRIEALSNVVPTVSLIRYLRLVVSWEGEIDPDILKRWRESNSNPELNPSQRMLLIYQSRLKMLDSSWRKILELKEKLWANYDEDNLFYRFYDFSFRTVIDVGHALNEMVINDSLDRETQREMNLRKRNRELRETAFSSQNDNIEKAIKQFQEEIDHVRKRRKWYQM